VKKILILLATLMILTLVITTVVSCAEPEPGPSPAPTPAPAKPAVLLRLASSYPVGDPQEYLPTEMAERFNQRAGGKYTMEVHPAQTLVHIAEGLDAVRTGSVEIAIYPTGPCVAADIRFAASELPFLYNNIRADAEGMKELAVLFNDILESNFNQKALNGTSGGACELISKKPIKSLEDFKGVLTQSLSPTLATFLELMGASPVAMAGHETYSGLQKGVIDAALTPPDAMKAFGMWEVADYVTFGYFAPTADVCTINMDVWNAMPNDIQDLLVEEMDQLGQDVQNARIKQWDENPALFTSHGMEVFNLTADERSRWQALAEPVFRGKMLDDMGDFGKQVREIADKVNAKYPY
jgi:TRAP-type C4-dicarboxylate transport system substrate-binding protein